MSPLDPRQLATVNWGKSYAPARGQVEFIRVAVNPLQGARDFTIYLGDISQLEGIFSDRPYEVTFANGGTSSVENVVASIRGTAIHVVASEVVVRGDTSPGEDIPARAAFRYQAHCAFGSPREHTVGAIGGQSINAMGIINLQLAPFSTHAWLDGLTGDPTDLASNVEVTQIRRSYGVETPVTTPVPASVYAQPQVLGAEANYLRFDVGAPPAEVIRWVFAQKIVR